MVGSARTNKLCDYQNLKPVNPAAGVKHSGLRPFDPEGRTRTGVGWSGGQCLGECEKDRRNIQGTVLPSQPIELPQERAKIMCVTRHRCVSFRPGPNTVKVKTTHYPKGRTHIGQRQRGRTQTHAHPRPRRAGTSMLPKLSPLSEVERRGLLLELSWCLSKLIVFLRPLFWRLTQRNTLADQLSRTCWDCGVGTILPWEEGCGAPEIWYSGEGGGGGDQGCGG